MDRIRPLRQAAVQHGQALGELLDAGDEFFRVRRASSSEDHADFSPLRSSWTARRLLRQPPIQSRQALRPLLDVGDYFQPMSWHIWPSWLRPGDPAVLV